MRCKKLVFLSIFIATLTTTRSSAIELLIGKSRREKSEPNFITITNELCRLFEVKASELVNHCRNMVDQIGKLEAELKEKSEILAQHQVDESVRSTLLKEAHEKAQQIREDAEKESKMLIAHSEKEIEERRYTIDILETRIKELKKRFKVHPLFKNKEMVKFCIDGQCIELDKTALTQRFPLSLLSHSISREGFNLPLDGDAVDIHLSNAEIFKLVKQGIDDPMGIIASFDKLTNSEIQSLDNMLDYLNIGRSYNRIYALPYINSPIEFDKIMVRVDGQKMTLQTYWQNRDNQAVELVDLDGNENFDLLLKAHFEQFFSLTLDNKQEKFAAAFFAFYRSLYLAHTFYMNYFSYLYITILPKDEANLPFKRWLSALKCVFSKTTDLLDSKIKTNCNPRGVFFLRTSINNNANNKELYNGLSNIFIPIFKEFYATNAKILLQEAHNIYFLDKKFVLASSQEKIIDLIEDLLQIDDTLKSYIEPWLELLKAVR